MDYVREELTRQWLALSQLLMGEQAETAVSGRNTGTGQVRDPAQRRTSGLPEETPEREEAFLLPEGQYGGQTLPSLGSDGQLTESVWLRRERQEGSQAAAGETGVAGTGGPEKIAADMRRELTDGPDWEERTVTEVLWTDASGMVSPGVLSRTFQRDARRYDGGFSLYR